MNIPNDLNNIKDYPGMVHWFSPKVLLNVLQKVIASTLFGQYADRRIVQAIDGFNPETVVETYCRGEKGIRGENTDGPLWIDYVADLGDGFDSTYAIAYLIGSKSIQVGTDTQLPRADCLIMGGDQVYPDASRKDYEIRMERPYQYAFPREQGAPGRPPVYLIPGNHDWYDGLVLFLAKFCRGRATSLGSWVATQSRSYFAVHLGNNWWIWGFDSQLGDDIDRPQGDYFKAVANKMKPNAKVILCASVPSWLKADLTANEEEQAAYKLSLDYMARLVQREASEGAKIPLVLSGDLHHYSRYIAKDAGTTFITAGGGGAFLHPTHHLSDKIVTTWAKSDHTLEIGYDTGSNGTKKAFYPPQDASRWLALGNLLFVLKNWDFCLVLGLLYAFCGVLMLAWSGYGEDGGNGTILSRFWNQIASVTSTPMVAVVGIALVGILWKAADVKKAVRKITAVGIHWLIHLVVILSSTALLSVSIVELKSMPWGDGLYFFGLLIGMLLFGFVGGFVWGIYLTIVSFLWGDHANDAFSAMRLDSYRHFLRLKIEDNKITIYPVGIDKSPKRQDWKFNKDYQEGNQNFPVVIPTKDLNQHLIEDPVVIDIDNIPVLKTV